MARSNEDILRGDVFGFRQAAFLILEASENSQAFFEVWRRSCDSYGECWKSLIAEANTLSDARELVKHYQAIEAARKVSQS